MPAEERFGLTQKAAILNDYSYTAITAGKLKPQKRPN